MNAHILGKFCIKNNYNSPSNRTFSNFQFIFTKFWKNWFHKISRKISWKWFHEKNVAFWIKFEVLWILVHDVSYQAGNQIIVSDEETQLVSPNKWWNMILLPLFHHLIFWCKFFYFWVIIGDDEMKVWKLFKSYISKLVRYTLLTYCYSS